MAEDAQAGCFPQGEALRLHFTRCNSALLTRLVAGRRCDAIPTTFCAAALRSAVNILPFPATTTGSHAEDLVRLVLD